MTPSLLPTAVKLSLGYIIIDEKFFYGTTISYKASKFSVFQITIFPSIETEPINAFSNENEKSDIYFWWLLN